MERGLRLLTRVYLLARALPLAAAARRGGRRTGGRGCAGVSNCGAARSIEMRPLMERPLPVLVQVIVVLLLLLAAACGSDDARPGRDSLNAGAAAVAGAAGVAAVAGMSSAGRVLCESGRMPAMSPRSVVEVVEMLNAMPKPVTLPCFLETLARPLALQATSSVLSAQPAVGKRSPRVFVFMGPLIVSVAPDGVGRDLLELGEQRSETHSLKAELEFPITAELGPTDPYTRLRYDDRLSTCDFCHADPSPAPELSYPYALISRAMRPIPRERVAIETLRVEAEACDHDSEAERCEMLDALFDATSQPSEAEFPATYRTFL